MIPYRILSCFPQIAGDVTEDTEEVEWEEPVVAAIMEELEEEEKLGPTLGQILKVGVAIFVVFYVLGMSYKLYKIWRGEYTEEEPVFRKYK